MTVIHSVPGAGRRLALTFDDGPCGPFTSDIVDLLEEHGAHATFFVLGSAAAKAPGVLRRIAAAGHEIGNHTFTHRSPQLLNDEQIRAELVRTHTAIIDATPDSPVTLVRPPYGHEAARVDAVAKLLGYPFTVLYSIVPRDWENRSQGEIVDVVVRTEPREGAIVLLHDGYPPEGAASTFTLNTVKAVRILVPRLQHDGFELVTVSQLIHAAGVDL